MAGLPRLPRLPQERAAKIRLPRVQRDRHDVPWLLVESPEGVEALPDFLMKPEQASTLTYLSHGLSGITLQFMAFRPQGWVFPMNPRTLPREPGGPMLTLTYPPRETVFGPRISTSLVLDSLGVFSVTKPCHKSEGGKQKVKHGRDLSG